MKAFLKGDSEGKSEGSKMGPIDNLIISDEATPKAARAPV